MEVLTMAKVTQSSEATVDVTGSLDGAADRLLRLAEGGMASATSAAGHLSILIRESAKREIGGTPRT